MNRIGGVFVSMLASSAVDRVFEPLSDQTKYYKKFICCFSAKHTALRRKSKDWLARNQDNVSEWGDMSIHGQLFQWTSTIKIQLTCWFRTKRTYHHLIENELVLTMIYIWKIAELALNNNHSLTYLLIWRWK